MCVIHNSMLIKNWFSFQKSLTEGLGRGNIFAGRVKNLKFLLKKLENSMNLNITVLEHIDIHIRLSDVNEK